MGVKELVERWMGGEIDDKNLVSLTFYEGVDPDDVADEVLRVDPADPEAGIWEPDVYWALRSW